MRFPSGRIRPAADTRGIASLAGTPCILPCEETVFRGIGGMKRRMRLKDDVDLAGGVPGRVLGMRSHRELFARRLRTTGALQALCRIATAGRLRDHRAGAKQHGKNRHQHHGSHAEPRPYRSDLAPKQPVCFLCRIMRLSGAEESDGAQRP